MHRARKPMPAQDCIHSRMPATLANPCSCARSMLWPCRRARAAYAAWSEQWIADMKLEKPGLRQQQYKDLCWKAWQRSPDNPLNQVKPPS